MFVIQINPHNAAIAYMSIPRRIRLPTFSEFRLHFTVRPYTFGPLPFNTGFLVVDLHPRLSTFLSCGFIYYLLLVRAFAKQPHRHPAVCLTHEAVTNDGLIDLLSSLNEVIDSLILYTFETGSITW